MSLKNGKVKFLVILPFAILTACHCDKQEVIYSAGSQMYDYVFRDSSVWIYRNISTNVEDTVTLFRLDRTFFGLDTSDKCIDLKKEVFYLNQKSSYTPDKEFYFFIDKNGIRLNGDGDFPLMGQQLQNIATDITDSSTGAVYIQTLPFLIVEGHYTYNVKKVVILDKSDMYPSGTYLYWSPDIGIVRKEIYDTVVGVQTWDLKYSKLNYY